MGIFIIESKVQHVAIVLYNVYAEVESDSQVRTIVMQNGVRLMPSPEISLVGARDEAILDLFGPKVFGAVKASCIYQKEQQRGIRPTRCVSMLVHGDARQGAVIKFNLGIKEGIQIGNQLC